MDLPVLVSSKLNYQVNLPQSFLNYLLSEGYQFDQGVLCLKLTSMFGCYFACMKEFTNEHENIEIGYEINSHLNLLDGDYLHIERCLPEKVNMVKIQGHEDSFGQIVSIKEKLETLFTSVKIINKGSQFILNGEKPETFTVVDILTQENQSINWFLSIDTDVKIDFLPTLESIEKEKIKKEKERLEREKKALEERGFKGEGKKLGGNLTRDEWLKNLDKK